MKWKPRYWLVVCALCTLWLYFLANAELKHGKPVSITVMHWYLAIAICFLLFFLRIEIAEFIKNRKKKTEAKKKKAEVLAKQARRGPIPHPRPRTTTP